MLQEIEVGIVEASGYGQCHGRPLHNDRVGGSGQRKEKSGKQGRGYHGSMNLTTCFLLNIPFFNVMHIQLWTSLDTRTNVLALKSGFKLTEQMGDFRLH
jgi:hypothetical protein